MSGCGYSHYFTQVGCRAVGSILSIKNPCKQTGSMAHLGIYKLTGTLTN